MVRVLSDGTVDSSSPDGSSGTFGTPNTVRDALKLCPGDTAWLAKRSRVPEVSLFDSDTDASGLIRMFIHTGRFDDTRSSASPAR